jgi:hypothetical protein
MLDDEGGGGGGGDTDTDTDADVARIVTGAEAALGDA